MSIKELHYKIKKEGTLESLEYSLSNIDFYKEGKIILLNTINNFMTATPENQRFLKLKLFELITANDLRSENGFHPSEFSIEQEVCTRKMYFQHGKAPINVGMLEITENNNKLLRIFDLGKLIHLYVQSNLYKKGLLVDVEVPVKDDETGTHGHADAIIFHQGKNKLVEIKSISPYGYKVENLPKDEHIKQASIYAGVLKIDIILFIYYNKANSELKYIERETDFVFFELYRRLTKGVISKFSGNSRRARSVDIKKHDNIPQGICNKITNEKAVTCPFSNFCFMLKK
jgi:hypothetical protein